MRLSELIDRLETVREENHESDDWVVKINGDYSEMPNVSYDIVRLEALFATKTVVIVSV